jgi:hypothetical protein
MLRLASSPLSLCRNERSRNEKTRIHFSLERPVFHDFLMGGTKVLNAGLNCYWRLID